MSCLISRYGYKPGFLYGHNHNHKQHAVGRLIISALIICTVPDIGTESTSQLQVNVSLVLMLVLLVKILRMPLITKC